MTTFRRVLDLFRLVAALLGAGSASLGIAFVVAAFTGGTSSVLSSAVFGVAMLVMALAYVRFAVLAPRSGMGGQVAFAAAWLLDARLRQR